MNAHPVLGAQIIAPVTKLAAGAADHPPPPRVVQRLGLPGPPHRRRDPEARPHPPRRRRLRGDDRRPPVPDDPADRRAGARRAAQVRRHPVRPGRRRRLRPNASTSKAWPTRAARSSRDRSRSSARSRAQMTTTEHEPGRRAGLTAAASAARPLPRPAPVPACMTRVTDAPSPASPVLIGGILLGLLLGLLGRRSPVEPRHHPAALGLGSCSLAVIIRFGTEALLNAGVGIVETLRLPLLLLGLRPAARRPVGQPRLPGPGPRLRRHPAQRRSSS